MLTVKEAIDNYYKLKSKYEEQIKKIKQSLINNEKLSIREKRKQYNEFKPKCINCQRPVGTIFSINYDQNEDYRSLLSFCGDRVNPCSLNININVGNYMLLPDLLKINEYDIEEVKNNIIIDKNKLLFGLLDTEKALDNFDEYKQEINSITTLLEYYLESYNDLVNNKEKNEELTRNIELLNVQISSIKKAIQEFNSTNNIQFIKDAVDIYINNIYINDKSDNLMKKIQDLKYRQKYVEYNSDTNTYHLIENKVGIENLEIDMREQTVISFDMGGKDMQKGQKTKKSKEKYQEIKPKTKKNKKELLIIEDSDEDTEDELKAIDKLAEQQDKNKQPLNIQVKDYIVNSDNTVSWSDPIYQQIWDTLSDKYKNALIGDTNWMKLTMDNYADKKKNKLEREFILPNNLIIPPKKSLDNKYDFGNKTINDLFNSSSEVQQESLLSMIPKVDNEKQRKSFLYALSLVIGQKLGFSKY